MSSTRTTVKVAVAACATFMLTVAFPAGAHINHRPRHNWNKHYLRLAEKSFFTEGELSMSSPGSDRVHWDNVGGVPEGFADGSDASFGMPIVRWGNDTAPPGTSLLYGGIAFGSHHTHPGGDEVCMAGGDPGASTSGATGDLLYPVNTATPSPPGVTADKLVRCAVLLPDGPSFLLWGSWTAPGGWTLVYKGYSMAGHYTHAGTAERHCVDGDSFDAGTAGTGVAMLWHGSSVHISPSVDYTAGTWVKCSVWVMT